MSKRSDTPVLSSVPVAQELPGSNLAERRSGIRHSFTAGVEIHEVRSKAIVSGRCSDLGLGGCYVDTPSPLSVGAVVTVRMEHEHREFEAAAVVAYAHLQMGMGLAFTDIKPKSQRVLLSWIGELRGERAMGAETSPDTISSEDGEGATNLRFALNELINLLVRRRLITESDAAGLLRQTYR